MAAAGWLGSWLGTGASTGQLAGGVVGAMLLLPVAVLRRCWWVGGIALVLVLGMAVGVVHHHRLATGPVSELAESGAVVEALLVTRTDPHVKAAAGPLPPFLTVRALVTQVEGRGAAWAVRAPVLVIVSGAPVDSWNTVVVGSRLRVQGRLQAPNPGSDLAGVLRVRQPATVVAPPTPGLRLVERVRAGLREAVSARRAEPRALVPAVVLGTRPRCRPRSPKTSK